MNGPCLCLLISAPSLGVYYFLPLTLSVCHGQTSNRFFFFVSGIEPFLPSVFHDPLYKTLFFDFWFRPLTHKMYSPKFGKKSPITRLVWQIDRRCLGLLWGFRGWPIQWNDTKRCGADPCCHGNAIWPRRGDLNAYRLVTNIVLLERGCWPGKIVEISSWGGSCCWNCCMRR